MMGHALQVTAARRAGGQLSQVLWSLAWLLLLLGQAIAQSSGPATQVGQAAKPRTAYEERLDLLLQQRRFSELFEAVKGKDVNTIDRALTWLRIELNEHGQGVAIGYMYTVQLFRAGSTLSGLTGDAFKQAALTTMVMTRWMVATEGFQCADTSAVANRLQLLRSGFAELDSYYKSIALVDQQEVARRAFKLLQARYPRRVDDPWLCGDGPTRPAKDWADQRERALQDIVRATQDELQVKLR
jgi:hypothetical protein